MTRPGTETAGANRTDWEGYYDRPAPFHSVLERIVRRRLLRCLRRFPPPAGPLTVVEFGGGNSCFYDALRAVLEVETYLVVDSSAAGLERLRERAVCPERLRLLNQDILQAGVPVPCGLVFSVGLIEHFRGPEVERAVRRHLEPLVPGGLLILGFPTPTWAYRLIRRTAERLGRWRFPDETPLPRGEVEAMLAPHATVLESTVIWSIGTTQAMVVARKRRGSASHETST